jgi:hypothetical protein
LPIHTLVRRKLSREGFIEIKTRLDSSQAYRPLAQSSGAQFAFWRDPEQWAGALRDSIGVENSALVAAHCTPFCTPMNLFQRISANVRKRSNRRFTMAEQPRAREKK